MTGRIYLLVLSLFPACVEVAAQDIAGSVVRTETGGMAGLPGVRVEAQVLRAGRARRLTTLTDANGNFALPLGPEDRLVRSLLFDHDIYEISLVEFILPEGRIIRKTLEPIRGSSSGMSYFAASQSLSNYERVFEHHQRFAGSNVNRNALTGEMRLKYGPRLLLIPDFDRLRERPRGDVYRDHYQDKRRSLYALYGIDSDDVRDTAFRTKFELRNRQEVEATAVIVDGRRGAYFGILPDGTILYGDFYNLRIAGNDDGFSVIGEWSQNDGLKGTFEWKGSFENGFTGVRRHRFQGREFQRPWNGRLFDE